MQDLYKAGLNPYDDEAISISELHYFAGQHLALVLGDPVAGEVSLELTAVDNALDSLHTQRTGETVKLGLRKARVQAKNEFREALANELSKIHGAALAAYGRKGVKMLELFPKGREDFGLAEDSQLGGKLGALHTAVSTHVAELGAGIEALALSLDNQWATIYGSAVAAKAEKGSAADARRQGVRELRLALGKLRLKLGLVLFGEIDRLRRLFPQHLLGFPLAPAKGGGDEGEGGGDAGLPG